MSEKKQTAVMWLIEQLDGFYDSVYDGEFGNITELEIQNAVNEIKNQALQMEREQIEEAYNQGDIDGYHCRKDNQYYINNYGE